MYDYVVIGAGAAGASFSWRMASKGWKVLCIDRGPKLDTQEYPTTKHEWEALKETTFNPVASSRKLESDYPVDDTNSPISVCNFNAVGGSTVLYSGHYPRFLKDDFKILTKYGIGADWPIEYEDLLPYFATNEKEMSLSGLAGDVFYPEIEDVLPPVPLGKVGERLAKGFNEKAWHWWPSFAAISTRAVRGRSKCINLGPCNVGCPQEAKSSVDITYLSRAKAFDFELKSNFAVSKIITEGTRAVGVEGFAEDGNSQVIYGKNIVLAASALGTPRILLNSASKQFPNGLANRSGMIGKNLMLHPLGYVEGLFSDYLETEIGPQGCMLYSLEFYRSQDTDHKLGYMMHALRGAGPIEVVKSAIARRKFEFGKNLYGSFKKYFGKQAVIAIICEDLPSTKNFVELDFESTDKFGDPGIKVNYQISENTKLMLKHGMGKARDVMSAAGAEKSYAHGPVRNTGWHIMGTCKMGGCASDSVVNEIGKTHDVDGLYIVDSSIFPTGSCVNPANTIQSLALYLADKIHESI